jgi:2-polyprenyl-3-methyl-5-hydroxy-6-metoxy-1,4-benzoquinol methylase
MGTFDSRAREWDKPDRIKMAANICLCMVSALSLNKKMTAIDFGAGTGLITLELAKKLKSITALDGSQGMINEINEKVRHGEITNVRAVLFDIEKDRVEIEPADVIISSMAMHHVGDIDIFSGRIYKMLKPGGQIAIADLEKEDGTFHKAGMSTGVKHNGFDRDALGEIFKQNGFQKIRFSTAYKIKRGKKAYPVFMMLAERKK